MKRETFTLGLFVLIVMMLVSCSKPSEPVKTVPQQSPDQRLLIESRDLISRGDYQSALVTLENLKTGFPTSVLLGTTDSLMQVCHEKQIEANEAKSKRFDELLQNLNTMDIEQAIAKLRVFTQQTDVKDISDRARKALQPLLMKRWESKNADMAKLMNMKSRKMCIEGYYKLSRQGGELAIAKQDFQQAERSFLAALEDGEIVYGLDSPEVVSILAGLAQVYSATKQHEKALEIFDRMYPLLRKGLAKDSGDLNNVRKVYSELLRANGRNRDAEKVEANG